MPPLRITTNKEKSKSPKPVDLKTLKQSKNVCVCMLVYARVRMATNKQTKKHGVYFVLVKCIKAWGLHWSVINIVIYSLEKTYFSLFQKTLIANSFLTRVKALYPVPLFFAGILSGLDFCRSHMCCCSPCEFLCVPVLLHLKDGVSLLSSTTPDS